MKQKQDNTFSRKNSNGFLRAAQISSKGKINDFSNNNKKLTIFSHFSEYCEMALKNHL